MRRRKELENKQQQREEERGRGRGMENGREGGRKVVIPFLVVETTRVTGTWALHLQSFPAVICKL